MAEHVRKLVIVCDACCKVANANLPGRSRTGDCAAGAIYLNGEKNLTKKIAEKGEYLGTMTVPEAEYNALLMALEHAASICRHEIEVWMDSELVIKHLNKVYRLSADNLKPLYDRVKQLEARFDSVSYYHHNRENACAREADRVADATIKSAKS